MFSKFNFTVIVPLFDIINYLSKFDFIYIHIFFQLLYKLENNFISIITMITCEQLAVEYNTIRKILNQTLYDSQHLV